MICRTLNRVHNMHLILRSKQCYKFFEEAVDYCKEAQWRGLNYLCQTIYMALSLSGCQKSFSCWMIKIKLLKSFQLIQLYRLWLPKPGLNPLNLSGSSELQSLNNFPPVASWGELLLLKTVWKKNCWSRDLLVREYQSCS